MVGNAGFAAAGCLRRGALSILGDVLHGTGHGHYVVRGATDFSYSVPSLVRHMASCFWRALLSLLAGRRGRPWRFCIVVWWCESTTCIATIGRVVRNIVDKNKFIRIVVGCQRTSITAVPALIAKERMYASCNYDVLLPNDTPLLAAQSRDVT